ncbi:MAG TPA: hypothetical protein VGB68_07475 [Pyrinomonadaceae bacterium]|jgi:hypothetical protein
MNEFIKNTVSRHSSLKFKANNGEDRVRKSGLKGSLWIKRRYDGFRLQTTSDIATILDGEIERLQGSSAGEQKGYKYWYIDDFHIVEKIIEILARP